ncbi:flavodoxin domain-containing protein [Actinopolymorpha pittospori]
MTTRVLVAYATRDRRTAGIAERIGADLISEGLEVKVAPAKAVDSVAGYDAFVLGGAMHGGRWDGARSFAERFGPQLADRTRHRGHTGDREEQEIDNWAHEVANELGFGDASSPSGRQPPS